MNASEALTHIDELLSVAETEGAARPEDYEAFEVITDCVTSLRVLLTRPSNYSEDAKKTEDGYTLTPLQIAERNARMALNGRSVVRRKKMKQAATQHK
jgi:hypothetical protein